MGWNIVCWPLSIWCSMHRVFSGLSCIVPGVASIKYRKWRIMCGAALASLPYRAQCALVISVTFIQRPYESPHIGHMQGRDGVEDTKIAEGVIERKVNNKYVNIFAYPHILCMKTLLTFWGNNEVLHPLCIAKMHNIIWTLNAYEKHPISHPIAWSMGLFY